MYIIYYIYNIYIIYIVIVQSHENRFLETVICDL
jgi:hypothetical protein